MASFRKRGKTWQVRYFVYDVDGVRHEKTKSGFPTKSAAKKYAIEFEHQVNSGETNFENPSFVAYFDRWYKTFKEPKVTDNTKRHYNLTRNLLADYFKTAKIRKIRRTDFQEFINQFGKDHAPESVRKVYSISHACIKSAVADGILPHDIALGTTVTANKDNVEKIEYLSMSDIEKLLKELNSNKDPRYTSSYMIITAIYTGARLAEIASLTWNDIGFEDKTIDINKSWDYLHHGGFKSTKNESSNRIIAVNQKLLDTLSELKANNSVLVFKNAEGSIPTSNGVNKVLRHALKQAGIDKSTVHFHSLRHTHVAYLISQGIDLYTISKRLGHSTVTTTSRVYAYLMDEYKQKQNDDIRQKLQAL